MRKGIYSIKSNGQIHSEHSIDETSFPSVHRTLLFFGVCIFLLSKLLFLIPCKMLKFYDSVIKPNFYIGPIPLYTALFNSKYDQLEEEGTNLAEF